jgi:hypothetical protein
VLTPQQIDRFPNRDDVEDLPEIVAVLEAWETSLLGAEQEALHDAQGDVLLVSPMGAALADPVACQPDEPLEVRLPEPLSALAVTTLEPIQASADRIDLVTG